MRLRTGGRAVATAVASGLMAVGLVAVQAASAPPAVAAEPPLPETASADSLPTVQINGVVWDQVIVGNTVYVGGEFTRARPAGAAAGVNETVRNNMLAYNLTTGALITSFDPNLNGQVKDLAVTPDQTKLIAVGAFTSSGSQARSRVAVFDLPSGNLSTTVVPSINGGAQSVAATNSTIYLGGYFSSVNGGLRVRIAAVRASNGQLLPFHPSVEGEGGIVQSMVVSPDEQSVVMSGNFTGVNGSTDPGYGLARVDAVTGALLPLPINTRVRNAGPNSGVLRLKSDGERFYGVGWHYGRGGNMEGYFAANWSDGSLSLMQDCHGDHYDLQPIGNVVYTSSHAHYCGNSAGFPQTTPGTNRHAGAWSNDARGVNKGDIYDYPDHPGTPRPDILNFYPPFVSGTYTDSAQATWTVTGNSDYVLYGGEFTRASGSPQQGLARFAIGSAGPDTRGPRLTAAAWTPNVRSNEPGSVRVQWQPNEDWDDSKLTYEVFRGTMTNEVHETVQDAQFFRSSSMVFTDTDPSLTPGSTVQYRIRATDPDGNTATSNWVSVTVATAGLLDPYARAVLDDGATKYWRLNETGTTVQDLVGVDNPAAGTGVSRNVAGALLNSADRASGFNGSSSGRVISTERVGGTGQSAGPQVFSVEAWFKTSSSSGGKIVSYGNSATGTSSTYDRDLYLDSSRRVSFSLRGRSRVVLRTNTAYNDNQWHHAVGTFSSTTGADLYVDGRQVASDDTLPAVREAKNYWRVGGDGTASGAQYLNGSIDEFAVYDRVLSPVDVNEHWVASGRPSALPNQAPDGDFSVDADKLDVSFDASASSDSDGTITSYAWSFGDGSTGTGALTQHTYSEAGTYDVTLTVTDDDGATDVVTQQVTVTAPVPGLLADDDFDRTVSNGWGEAATGGPWSTSGSATSFSVGGSAGRMRFATSGTLDADLRSVSSTDSQVTTEFSVDKIAEGNYVSLTGREVGSDRYSARLRMEANGQVRLYLLQNFNSVATNLLVPGLTIVPGERYTLRMLVTGTAPTTVAAKVWKSSDPEPADWQRSGTNSFAALQAPGHVGAEAYLPGSAAAQAPVTVSLHDFEAVSPQALPNRAPTARFDVARDNLVADFDATGSSDPDGPLTSYAWSFGDGSTGTGATPRHTYGATGNYTVTLTVTDEDGAQDQTTQQVSVTAANQPPTPAFTDNPNGLSVDFDGSGSSDPDGTIASYAWDFGDGSSGTGATPSHTYAQGGSYTVALTVTDNSGTSRSVSRSVTVTAPAAEVLAQDDFNRTVTGGWGSAETGGPWTLTGPATRFSVAGGDARLQTASGQTLLADLLGVSSQRTLVTAEFSVDKVAEGTYVAVVGRQIGADYYTARVRLQADGQARLYLLQNFNSVGTSYLIPGLTVVPGENYKIALEVTGVSPTTVSGKMWRSSDPEPTGWQRSATNAFASLQNPGRVGVFSYLPGTASAVAPVTVTFHNILATRPPA